MIRAIAPIETINDFRTMEQMLDRLFRVDSAPAASPFSAIPIDVLETDGKLVVRASVPGIKPEELDVTVEKNVLTIRGEVHQLELSEGTKVYRRENVFGTFSRSLRLPENLDLNQVDAEFKNGVVTISIPRIIEEKPQPVKINVRSIEA